MIKKIIIVFCLFYNVNFYAQNNSVKSIDFYAVEKKIVPTSETNAILTFKYDFKILDSLNFYQNVYENEKLAIKYQDNFELQTNDGKSIIKFECKETIAETCYQYAGYSDYAEVHIISKCKDICEVYLIDANNGETVSLISEFDNGSIPLFLPEYMIVCGSYYDDSFVDYYENRTVIDIYKFEETSILANKFKYIGTITSKNWSIQEIYESKNEKSLLIKIYDKSNDFSYLEINFN